MKNRLLYHLCLLIYVLPFFLAINIQAREERYYKGFTDGIIEGSAIIVNDERMFSDEGELIPEDERESFRDKSATGQIRLVLTNGIYPELATEFSCLAGLKIKYKDSGGDPDSINVDLQVHFSPDSSYHTAAVFRLPGAHYLHIEIISLSLMGISSEQLARAVRLIGVIEIDRYYRIDVTESPEEVRSSIVEDGTFLQFNWPPIIWAGNYHLEWTYVSDYDRDGSFLSPADLEYNFRFNSNRVELKNTEYRIPVVFEHGYLIFRVRAVGLGGPDLDRIVYGNWTIPEIGNVSGTRYKIHISGSLVHEQDGKNWQYTANFAENGLARNSVVYFDGTFRERQVVSLLQSEKKAIISETFFDQFGRNALKINPATLAKSGDEPEPRGSALKFYKDFNLNRSGQPISWRDFDFLTDETDRIEPFSVLSGAAKYFSPQNEDQSGPQQFLPDSEGYPMVQIEFTPDNTGRIRRQGGIGKGHQLGSGHEAKYFYGVPAQQELDRLFGNDVGFAEHYQKNMIIDANGQASVEYLDLKGNVIASGLAGNPPENLEPVENESTLITMNLLEEENQLDPDSYALRSSKNFIITNDRTRAIFSYHLFPETLSSEDCLGMALCFDCIYDLRFILSDDDRTVLFDTLIYVGNLRELNVVCDEEREMSLVFFKELNRGSYRITKELKVNLDAANEYADEYLNTAFCEDWIPFAGFAPDPEGCNMDCADCNTGASAASAEIMAADGHLEEIELNGEAISALNRSCDEICETRNPCSMARQQLLFDVSPGGQYALYHDSIQNKTDPSIFPLSILNVHNILDGSNKNWKFPPRDYEELDGRPSWVEVTAGGMSFDERARRMPGESKTENGHLFVKPQYLDDVRDFINLWKPSWASSLIEFHPEYCYLEWCMNMEESLSYDVDLMAISSFEEARAKGYLNPLSSDPYRELAMPGHWEELTESMDSYYTFPDGDSYDLMRMVYILVHCNAVTFDKPDLDRCSDGFALWSDPDKRDRKWEMLKNLYFSKKREVLDSHRESWITGREAEGCSDNEEIGKSTLSGNPFENKIKRFPGHNYILESYGITGGDLTERIHTFRDTVARRLYELCGQCPITYDLIGLLQDISGKGLLAEDFEIFEESSLTIDLVSLFPDPGSHSYRWMSEEKGDVLTITISSPKSPQCEIQLAKEDKDIGWNDIEQFICLKYTDSPQLLDLHPGRNFTLIGIDVNGRRNYMEGTSDCIYLNTCNFDIVCQPTFEAKDLGAFFTHLLTSDEYTATELTIHRRGETGGFYSHELAGLHPAGFTWYWNFLSWIETGRSFNGQIRIDNESAVDRSVVFCPFQIEIVTPGFTFSDITEVTKVHVDGSDYDGTNCDIKEFLLQAEDSSGNIFTIRLSNECFKTGSCCTDSEPACPNLLQPGSPGTNGNVLNFVPDAGDVQFPWEQTIELVEDGDYIINLSIIAKGKNNQKLSLTDYFELRVNKLPVETGINTFPDGKALMSGQMPVKHAGRFNVALVFKNPGGVSTKESWLISEIELRKEFCNGPGCCLPKMPYIAMTDPCPDLAESIAEQNRNMWKDHRRNFVRDSILLAYINHCLTAAEDFSAEYEDHIYQFTLYYYDQANNLVKTVPPEGVQALSGSDLDRVEESRTDAFSRSTIYPRHTMESTYHFNSLKFVTHRQSPDQGKSDSWYDAIGRIVVSQKANQKPLRYHYIMYDETGRIVESGEIQPAYAMSGEISRDPSALDEWIRSGPRQEISRTHFDSPMNPEVEGYFGAEGQNYLRNRIASTTYTEQENTGTFSQDYQLATHYSYDIHGNVETIIQEIQELLPVHQNLKKIDYTYDLITGNIKQIDYQKDRPDQFSHRYTYDADNRILSAQTSVDGILWEWDARYKYYDHGPLARVEIGEERVQGLDYAYTLSGALKAMNSVSLQPERDMGQDGLTSEDRYSVIPGDVAGTNLGYYQGDYRPIGGAGSPEFQADMAGSGLQRDTKNFYHGSISFVSRSIYGLSETNRYFANSYSYDQLNRLKGSRSFRNFDLSSNQWQSGPPMAAYQTSYGYDANGNILTLERNGADEVGLPLSMDQLTFSYNSGKNQLKQIQDRVPVANYARDLDNQEPDNYTYDSSGNLTSDRAAGISRINWTSVGKIRSISFEDGRRIQFKYNAAGQRIMKEIEGIKTWYLLDAVGKTLAIYVQNGTEFTWLTSPIYGSKRLGTFRANKLLTEESSSSDDITHLFRGKKAYELTDHLGNVLSVVSDRKVPVITGTIERAGETFYNFYYQPVIVSAQDYYPFGMLMPGRVYRGTGSSKYRYGFNGMEEDGEINGIGNSYTTDFRQYDPRVGRWLSVDPVFKAYESSFVGFANNPIKFIDSDGLDVREMTTEEFGREYGWDFQRHYREVQSSPMTDEGQIRMEAMRRLENELGFQITITDAPNYEEIRLSRETPDRRMRRALSRRRRSISQPSSDISNPDYEGITEASDNLGNVGLAQNIVSVLSNSLTATARGMEASQNTIDAIKQVKDAVSNPAAGILSGVGGAVLSQFEEFGQYQSSDLSDPLNHARYIFRSGYNWANVAVGDTPPLTGVLAGALIKNEYPLLTQRVVTDIEGRTGIDIFPDATTLLLRAATRPGMPAFMPDPIIDRVAEGLIKLKFVGPANQIYSPPHNRH